MSQNPDDSLINALKDLVERSENSSKRFLQKRNLLDPDHVGFGKNYNSSLLYNEAGQKFDDDPPFVLYGCIPKTKLELDITSMEIQNWFVNNKTVTIENKKITMLHDKRMFDLDSITFNDDYNGRIRHYVEFLENGYVEQGYTFPLIYDYKNDLPPALDLGRITSMLWGFLSFCKKFYDFVKCDSDFDIFLAIRNSRYFTLAGFNGKLENGYAYSEPDKTGRFTKTYRKNILLSKEILSTKFTEENIKKIVRRFSDKIANCYNLEFSYSYDYDGTLNEKNFYTRQYY